MVDAIQGLGAATLDVREAQIDILACGAQKWLLAPWGTGFVYVREELVRQLEPTMVSWMAMSASADFTRLTDYEFRYWEDARRFEVGTYPYTALLGLSESLDLVHTLGIERIAGHARTMIQRLEEGLLELGATIVSCREPACRSSILCFRAGDLADTRAIFDGLRSAGVTCAFREGSIRLSPHYYNTMDEIERTLETVETLRPAAARER